MEGQVTQRRWNEAGRFPNRIRHYRIQAGLSQRHLGDLIGTGRGSISKWERGQSLPGLKSAIHLAVALDTLTESLYIDLYHKARRGLVEKNSQPS